LLTGGSDRPYAFGLLDTLLARDMEVDFIGSDEFKPSEVLIDPKVNFLNLRGDTNPAAPRRQKIARIGQYYFRLLQYAAKTDAVVFHILWANRFILLDRILMNLYYKLMGKKIVFTAHNVNERQRDGCDSVYNRLTLRALYALVDHIFVHTHRMKVQLIDDFGVRENKISVIPFGINNTLPKTDLTGWEARSRLGLRKEDKVLLFFGRVANYKGLEYAIEALNRLVKTDDRFRLVVAGRIEKGCENYWNSIESAIEQYGLGQHVVKNIEFIPDEEVEVFFKSADVLILPYKAIFQSGLQFLAYSFGLPVIATDIGSFREDIVDGKTGLICQPEDADDLADKIHDYFHSELFDNLQQARGEIMEYGNRKYSWEEVGHITRAVYEQLLDKAGLSRASQEL
jgi:glycosyltransferase involved in cell wall biosynthesis